MSDRESQSPSRLVVHAGASLSRIAKELETRIEKRLADVRGADAGVAGRINYTVDRGPLSVSVEKNALVVRTNVRANAEICTRGRCYASCKPKAVAQARVPLQLGPDYRLARPRVTATITRGCKVKTLGGFLTIDVTPQLEKRLGPALRRAQRDIARHLPDLRPHVERVWAELAKSRQAPLLGCIAPRPAGIVQGPVEASGGELRLRFAVLAEPELREKCDETGSVPALPRLKYDPALPDEAELQVAIVSPLTEVASAFEKMPPVEVQGARVSVGRATVASRDRAIQVELALSGEICGEVSLSASPAWSADGRSLVLTSGEFRGQEAHRVEAASLRPEPLAEALASGPRVRVALDVEQIDEAIPRLVSSLSTEDFVEVAAVVSRVRGVDVVARGRELVSTLGIQGRVTLQQR